MPQQQPSTERVSRVDFERVRSENDRLRAENAALRPLVSQLQHELRIEKKHRREDAQDHG